MEWDQPYHMDKDNRHVFRHTAVLFSSISDPSEVTFRCPHGKSPVSRWASMKVSIGRTPNHSSHWWPGYCLVFVNNHGFLGIPPWQETPHIWPNKKWMINLNHWEMSEFSVVRTCPKLAGRTSWTFPFHPIFFMALVLKQRTAESGGMGTCDPRIGIQNGSLSGIWPTKMGQ